MEKFSTPALELLLIVFGPESNMMISVATIPPVLEIREAVMAELSRRQAVADPPLP